MFLTNDYLILHCRIITNMKIKKKMKTTPDAVVNEFQQNAVESIIILLCHY